MTVRIGVAEDSYIPRGELHTVTADLVMDGEVAATINTILDPDQDSEARALVRELVSGLESGELEPTAGSIEPVVDRLPETGA